MTCETLEAKLRAAQDGLDRIMILVAEAYGEDNDKRCAMYIEQLYWQINALHTRLNP